MENQEIINLVVKKLQANTENLATDFLAKNPATTTRFFVLDDLLPEEIAKQIYPSYPPQEKYRLLDTFRERKYTFAKLNQLENPLPEKITDALQSPAVIDEITKITQIKDLEGDPSLYAAGLSRMDQSHFLNPHIDNSHDGARKRYRRLNLLYYVTPSLKEQDGGNFELWNPKVTIPLKLPAKFNRLVVMETTKKSWHSVDMVQADVQRCCVSNYYFTPSSPTGSDYYHVTSFIGRPDQPVRRIVGRIDNFLRQKVATILGISRGKKLSRSNK